MLAPCYLAEIDPALHDHYLQNRLQPELLPLGSSGGSWSRSGPGPIAFIGNTWTNGVTLAPEFAVAGTTSLVAVSYDWAADRLEKWAPYCEVRLIITDVVNLRSYCLNATSSSSGSVLISADAELSANCSMVFQLRAGDRTGPLKKPPYIEHCRVSARFRGTAP
nr:hypothetical protein REQ54_04379 [Rhizobium sp. Q54]